MWGHDKSTPIILIILLATGIVPNMLSVILLNMSLLTNTFTQLQKVVYQPVQVSNEY